MGEMVDFDIEDDGNITSLGATDGKETALMTSLPKSLQDIKRQKSILSMKSTSWSLWKRCTSAKTVLMFPLTRTVLFS